MPQSETSGGERAAPMTANAYDFAVLGSGALPGLLAGFLALRHGRSVVLVGDSWSPLRVRRRIDMSIAPMTRPDSLSLLDRAAAETGAEIGRMGKGLGERIVQHWRADSMEGSAALGHFRQLARMLGHSVDGSTDKAGTLVRIKDALYLPPERLLPALAKWLDTAGVRRLAANATGVTVRRDGGARLAHAGVTAEAKAVILADDDVLARHLYPDGLDRVIVPVSMAAYLLEAPRRPAAAPYIGWPERGVELLADGQLGLSAIVAGPDDSMLARLGAAIAPPQPLGTAGSARFTAFRTVDGAPFMGPARGGRAIVLAGFGPTAAFLAPAIARAIAGESSADEAQWFAARGAGRSASRAGAAEPVGVAA